jgi:L-erythro-3,5-diaminohexanoate dehydrogenase
MCVGAATIVVAVVASEVMHPASSDLRSTQTRQPELLEDDGDDLGTHRVLAPARALPQPAERVDNDFSRLFGSEILVEVHTLNVDAASFRQMEEATPDGAAGVPQAVLATIAARGKQHNPVTGSGGMLLGTVAAIGRAAQDRGVVVGDKIATLASLSLTPLVVDEVLAVRRESAQLDVRGRAVIFHSAPFAKLPTDFEERVAVALFDVAGAAPQVARLVKQGDHVVVLGGGGKSGLLCVAEARRQVGPDGRVVAVENHAAYAAELRALGLCDAVVAADATDPVATRDAVVPVLGRQADAVFSCVNVPGAELSAIVLTRQRGAVYFFAMTTSFPRAALGAEGIGKDVDLFIGNGFAEGHADHTLNLVRESPALRKLIDARYG